MINFPSIQNQAFYCQHDVTVKNIIASDIFSFSKACIANLLQYCYFRLLRDCVFVQQNLTATVQYSGLTCCK